MGLLSPISLDAGGFWRSHCCAFTEIQTASNPLLQRYPISQGNRVDADAHAQTRDILLLLLRLLAIACLVLGFSMPFIKKKALHLFENEDESEILFVDAS